MDMGESAEELARRRRKPPRHFHDYGLDAVAEPYVSYYGDSPRGPSRRLLLCVGDTGGAQRQRGATDSETESGAVCTVCAEA